MDEERCVDNCAGKLIRSNHRLMSTYVQLMPRMVQRRMEEMESKAAENAKAAAVASVDVGAVATDASPESQAPVTPPSIQEVPSSFTTSVQNVGPDVNGSVLTPGLGLSNELDVSASKATLVQEVKPLIPVTETVNPSVLKTNNGPSYAAGIPEPHTAVSEMNNVSSAALLTQSKSASTSEDIPLSSKVTKLETLSGQGNTPDVPPPSGQ